MTRPAPMADGTLAALGKGWWNPEPHRHGSRYHYVGNDGTALCRKWLYLTGKLEADDGPSPDDCKACRKKLNALADAPGDRARRG